MALSLPRILIIAGSDSSGGAGIQADIKTVTMLGGYAMTAITAITVRNTLGVPAIHAVPPEIVQGQIEACLTDIGADTIKIGMLLNADIIKAVDTALIGVNFPIVLDPVMVATSGATLLDNHALDALKTLMCRAQVLTPNIPEAELLTGQKISCRNSMLEAAKQLRSMTHEKCGIVLKGGHLTGDKVHDLLYANGDAFWYESAKITTRHTHGTGCTLASAIATHLGKGGALAEATAIARDYVHASILAVPSFGKGHGPLNHMHPLLERK